MSKWTNDIGHKILNGVTFTIGDATLHYMGVCKCKCKCENWVDKSGLWYGKLPKHVKICTGCRCNILYGNDTTCREKSMAYSDV